MSIIDVIGIIIVLSVIYLGTTLIWDIPGFPWHKAWARRRKEKMLKSERESHRDITELAVGMGFSDPRPDGWYGFHYDTMTVILRLDDETIFRYSAYINEYSDPPEVLMRGMIKEVHAKAEGHFKVNRIRRELDAMTDPNKVVLGEPQEWVND